MSPEEWGAEPWYVTASYLEGLRAQGILGDTGDEPAAPTGKGPSGTGPKQARVDFTDGSPLPKGFRHRVVE